MKMLLKNLSNCVLIFSFTSIVTAQKITLHNSENFDNVSKIDQVNYPCFDLSLDDTYVVKSSVKEIWDISINDWTPSFQTLYDYNQNGNRIAVIEKQRVLNAWENSRREIYTFDQNNNTTEMNCDNWVNNQWENDYKMTYTYNQQGYDLIVVRQDWVNGNWENVSKLLYVLNQGGYAIEMITQQWQNNSWEDLTKISYTYDQSWHTLEALTLMWLNNNWIEFGKTIYTYDQNGNKTEELTQIKLLNNWNDQRRATYSYNQNGQNNGRLVETFVNNVWSNSLNYTYTFDGSGNIAVEIEEVWQLISQSWSNASRTTYNYQLITDADEIILLPGEYKLMNNFPNPFNPATTFRFSIPKSQNVSIKIFDLLGREVSDVVNRLFNAGSHQVRFNAFNLSSGIYFYVMKAGNYFESRKMLLLK